VWCWSLGFAGRKFLRHDASRRRNARRLADSLDDPGRTPVLRRRSIPVVNVALGGLERAELASTFDALLLDLSVVVLHRPCGDGVSLLPRLVPRPRGRAH